MVCELKLNSIRLIVLLKIELEKLKSFTVGSYSFVWVKELKMANLIHLETATINEGAFSSSKDGLFEMRFCKDIEKLVIGEGSFRHWNEFIISDCSIQKIGRDCFLQCEYSVFHSRLMVDFNNKQKLTTWKASISTCTLFTGMNGLLVN